MPVWTIKGEAGKAVDATARTLPDLSAEGGNVNFASLDNDVLSWSVWIGDPASLPLLPDLGQKITLYRDAGRYFTGTVTNRQTRFEAGRISADISVSGPWWYLRNMAISADIPDQSGEEKERTAFVFPTGSVRNHIQGLITRAIALGAPIKAGSIANCYNIPRISIRNVSFAEAFAELMRWVPDGMMYFDYTGPDDEFPALCMQRRPAATSLTLHPTNGVMTSVNVRPRIELQVEELKIPFAKRATVNNTRVTVWDELSAGGVVSDLPRRQLSLWTGPELSLLLPQDFTDSVVVRSALRAGQAGVIVAQNDERLRAAGASGFGVGTFTEPPFLGSTFTLPAIETTYTDRDGKPIPAGYDYWLSKGESKDWWTKDGIEFIEARLAATIYNTQLSPSPAPPDWEETPPLWFQTIGGQTWKYFVAGPDGARYKAVWAATVSVPVTLVKKSWSTDTTIIRAEDYAFIMPPEDLAENLLAAQSWLPYEGTVTHVVEEIPAGHSVGWVLNVASMTPELGTMRGMISGHSVSLLTGQMRYTLGAPDRLAYRDLVNRFRQGGADNIEWLVGVVSGDPGENPNDPGLEIPEIPTNAVLNEDNTYELDEDGSIAIDEQDIP